MAQNSHILIFFSIISPTFCQTQSGISAKSIYSYPGSYPVNYVLPEDKNSASYLSSPPVNPPESTNHYHYSNSEKSPDSSEYTENHARRESPEFSENHPRRDSPFESEEDPDNADEDSDEADGTDLDEYADSEDTAAAPSSPATAQTKEPIENPLNFLNLAGTDFQPGRMVNIFFGLLIIIFMIVTHGYILWIFGIAYLPGTRAIQEWQPNHEMISSLLNTVSKALDYWEKETNTP